jgi:hypothetical protein
MFFVISLPEITSQPTKSHRLVEFLIREGVINVPPSVSLEAC